MRNHALWHLLALLRHAAIGLQWPLLTQERKFAGRFPHLSVYGLISTSEFRRIIEHVRNRLLEWALELEKKGILGENMSFNEKEKSTAQNITVNNREKELRSRVTS